MTHSSRLLSSDLTQTHQLHQILQSFPSLVMWSTFRQLNCLHLKEVMMFQRPERQVIVALSSKISCPWSKCIVTCPSDELSYILCVCFYNLTIVQGDTDIFSCHFWEGFFFNL